MAGDVIVMTSGFYRGVSGACAAIRASFREQSRGFRDVRRHRRQLYPKPAAT
jgi:hypothetical protein